MSLRKKTILILGGSFFVLLLILAFFSRSYLLTSFSNLEDQYILRSLNQAESGIDEKISNLSIQLLDWSSWSSTYEYAKNKNLAYEKENLTDQAILQLGLSGMVISNDKGEFLFERCFSKDNRNRIAVPYGLKFAMHSERTLSMLSDGMGSIEGLVNTEAGPAMVAIRPILDSDGHGPARGTIMMFKFFQVKDIQELSHLLGLSVEINRVEDEKLPEDYREAISKLMVEDHYVKALNESRVGAYTMLLDIYQNKAFVLRVDAQRLITEQGKITVNFFMIALIIVGIAIILIILLILEKLVLHKVKILGDSARTIRETGDLNIRVHLDEKDELGILAENTNAMLDKILEVEKELITQKDAAEAANLEKSAFLANVSHEIRTPMNAIVGMTELLMETNLMEKQREFAYSVYDAGNLLLSIINDVLDFSKIESGRFALNHLRFSVSNVVESVAEILAVKAREKKLELSSYIPVGLPDVKGDPDRIKQVLVNLVGNAVKFTETGEVHIQVIEESRDKKYMMLRFEVSDTGIGIAPENQLKLFRPFIQADNSTTRIYGGTGLGLSISKKLIEMMEGSIKLESVLGEGSTFSFKVKLEYIKDNTEKNISLPLKGMNILVQTESSRSGDTWKAYLSASGADHVFISRNFTETKTEISKKTAYDYNLGILETDGGYTDMTWRFPKEIGIRSILIASYDPIIDGIQPIDEGFSALLLKPVKRNQLVRCIEMLVTCENNIGKELESPLKEECEKHQKELNDERSRVLLVDDNSVNRKLAALQLEKLGVNVQMAVNGKEAIEQMERNRYDMILMDCQMPVMDGFEATRHIRLLQTTQGYRVTIVAMTANAMSGDRERCLSAGMDDYMAKPVRLQNLVEIFDKWGIRHGEDSI